MTAARRVTIACSAALLAGCSLVAGQTPQTAAEQFIETELGPQFGLVEVDATCEDPGAAAPGLVFMCTSTMSDGTPLMWEASMPDEQTVDVLAVNLMTAEVLASYETAAAQLLTADAGVAIGADHVDCGAAPLALPADQSLACAVTLPTTGDVYDTTIVITDIAAGTFEVSVSPTPR